MRIKNKAELTSHGNRAGREIVTDLLDAGLDAIDPYYRMKALVELVGRRIVLHTQGFEMQGDPRAGETVYDLADYDRVFVIGAAKGIQHAALALEEVLGDVLTGGHVIDKHGVEIKLNRIGLTLAGHPVPDVYCMEGCRRIEALSRDITARDLVFTIFGSGCGSLFTYPAEGITLEDAAAVTRLLQIEKGAPTSELNQVRMHIDRFKGGRIARLFKPATLVNLVTADPAKIGTPVLRANYFGMMEKNTFFPAIAGASTYADAIAVLHKWDVWDSVSESVRRHLLAGTPETDNMSIQEYETLGARFLGLIFKDFTIYPAVRRRASELGYPCLMLSEYMEAEACEAGTVNAQIALCIERMGEPLRAPIVLMTSGENLVTVGGECGIGGRNQEYCIAAALKIAGSERIVFGAVDTDGTDGPGGLRLPGAPECLAGAVTDGYTLAEARAAGIDLWEALHTHSTSEALWKLGCGVHAEANVSALDLGVIFIM